MATDSAVAALAVPRLHRHARHGSVLLDFWQLTKPEINFLVAITAGTGFWMGTVGSLTDARWIALLQVVLGTALVASGAAALNQVIEAPYDAQMRRTVRRPLASGRIARAHGLWFGVGLSALGVSYLAISTFTLAAALAVLTLLDYLLVYTPLKRITPLCTVIGAIPGAAPPLIGWAAARGQLDPAAWLLFAIVFLWQLPHFTPIAWMYREDYARAGYRMLPSGENLNRFLAWQTVAAAAVLMAVGLLPGLNGLSGSVYFVGSVVLGGLFLFYSARFAIRKTAVAARQLLIVSILYLPAIFTLLVLDRN